MPAVFPGWGPFQPFSPARTVRPEPIQADETGPPAEASAKAGERPAPQRTTTPL